MRPLDIEAIKELAIREAPAAMRTLARIHADPKVPAKDRIRAAEIIVEHAIGKPTQSIAAVPLDPNALTPTAINFIGAVPLPGIPPERKR